MNFKEFKNAYKKLQTDSERQEFINKRIKQLIATTTPKKIGMKLTGSYHGFISPKMSVSSNASGIFEDMIMDDLDVYKEFMDYIDNDIDRYMYGEPITINIIQHFIWNYFGYNAGIVFDRMDIYSKDKPVSVKELKSKNIAACSERSVMAQNLLQFLGFDSEIVFGKLNDKESHAYIIFKPDGTNSRILYDPMNPVEYIVDNKKQYCPGVSKMSEEEYFKLQNGQSYTFNYNLVKRLFINNNEYTNTKRIYSSDEIKYRSNLTTNQEQLEKMKDEYINMIENKDVPYSYQTSSDGTVFNHIDFSENKHNG